MYPFYWTNSTIMLLEVGHTWIADYLYSRSQKVSSGKTSASTLSLKHGAPPPKVLQWNSVYPAISVYSAYNSCPVMQTHWLLTRFIRFHIINKFWWILSEGLHETVVVIVNNLPISIFLWAWTLALMYHAPNWLVLSKICPLLQLYIGRCKNRCSV